MIRLLFEVGVLTKDGELVPGMEASWISLARHAELWVAPERKLLRYGVFSGGVVTKSWLDEDVLGLELETPKEALSTSRMQVWRDHLKLSHALRFSRYVPSQQLTPLSLPRTMKETPMERVLHREGLLKPDGRLIGPASKTCELTFAHEDTSFLIERLGQRTNHEHPARINGDWIQSVMPVSYGDGVIKYVEVFQMLEDLFNLRIEDNG